MLNDNFALLGRALDHKVRHFLCSAHFATAGKTGKHRGVAIYLLTQNNRLQTRRATRLDTCWFDDVSDNSAALAREMKVAAVRTSVIIHPDAKIFYSRDCFACASLLQWEVSGLGGSRLKGELGRCRPNFGGAQTNERAICKSSFDNLVCYDVLWRGLEC